MARDLKSMRTALAVIGGFLFLTFVWPGLWVYGTSGSEMYRVNRFTGTKQWATDFGWLTADAHVSALEERRLERLGETAKRVYQDAKNGKVASANQNAERLIVRYASGEEAYFYGSDMDPISEALQKANLRAFTIER